MDHRPRQRAAQRRARAAPPNVTLLIKEPRSRRSRDARRSGHASANGRRNNVGESPRRLMTPALADMAVQAGDRVVLALDALLRALTTTASMRFCRRMTRPAMPTPRTPRRTPGRDRAGPAPLRGRSSVRRRGCTGSHQRVHRRAPPAGRRPQVIPAPRHVPWPAATATAGPPPSAHQIGHRPSGASPRRLAHRRCAALLPRFRVRRGPPGPVGIDYAEIAEVLDIPPGTVRSRIARGRGRWPTCAARCSTGEPGPADGVEETAHDRDQSRDRRRDRLRRPRR